MGGRLDKGILFSLVIFEVEFKEGGGFFRVGCWEGVGIGFEEDVFDFII